MKMHYGHDDNVFSTDLKQHPIWKCFCQSSANVCCNNWKQKRIDLNAIKRFLD